MSRNCANPRIDEKKTHCRAQPPRREAAQLLSSVTIDDNWSSIAVSISTVIAIPVYDDRSVSISIAVAVLVDNNRPITVAIPVPVARSDRYATGPNTDPDSSSAPAGIALQIPATAAITNAKRLIIERSLLLIIINPERQPRDGAVVPEY